MMKWKILQLKQRSFRCHGKENPQKSNLQELKLKSDSLFYKRDVIIKDLVRELQNGKMPTRECHTWLKKVKKIKDELHYSEFQISPMRSRLDAVMNEISEYLDKSPNKNDTVDDAMIGRSKRIKVYSKVGGDEYWTVGVGKTHKIQRTAAHLNAAAGESSRESKKSILGNRMQQNNDKATISAPLAAVSEPAETCRMKDGSMKAENKISLQNEGISLLAFDQSGGETPEKLGPEGLRLEKSASSKLLSQLSSMPHLELNDYETTRDTVSLERAETYSNGVESEITFSEVKEMSNTNEIKDSETERSPPETENSNSEAEGIEPIETREKQHGFCKAEGKIPVQQEAKEKPALDVEAGMTPKNPDAEEVKQAMSTLPGTSIQASTVAPSGRSENEAEQVITYHSSVPEEKINNVSSEIEEISPTTEMKYLQLERSIREPESSISDPEGITHKSERISSKSGNKRVNHMKPNLFVNMKNRLFPRSSSRSETVPLPPSDLTRKHDISFPQAGEGKRNSCIVQKIIECMKDDKHRRIGIYGKGGIGKTTILKALLCSPEIKDRFDFLIQVTVSRYWSREKIQLEIARQIKLSVEGLQSADELASKLFHALQSKKYLLLLDDVWDNINLEALGINLESHSRLAVATRSVHICKTMDLDQQMEVGALSWKEALNLFQEQVGGVMDSPDIRPRAEAIVSECGGLPLMIIVIGRALAKENDVLVWRLVLRNLLSVTCLKSCDPENQDEALLQKLKVVYDNMHDYDLKYCFLYCALFPDNHIIPITELMKYWIQEGLVTGNSSDASRKGFRIISHLTEASLLERVDRVSVKMHDLIRDLASWIILSEENSLEFLVRKKFNKVGNQELKLESTTISIADSPRKLPRVENCLLSRAGAGLLTPAEESEWEETKMIFLMDNDISKLPEEPNCPKLKMLFLQRNRRLTTIPASFFNSMPCLQFVNLSKTNIRSLPPSLYSLRGLQVLILRHCPCLSEISPRVGDVKSIEILDLTGTEIYSLPDSIGELSSLKNLHVSFYAYVDDNEFHNKHKNLVPCGIISKLQSLEELSIEVQPRDTRWNTDAEFVAEELSNLSKLDTLCICFPETKFLMTFLGSSPAWKAGNLGKFKFVIGHDIKRSASHVPRHTELDYDQEDKCLRYVNTDIDHIPSEVKEVLQRATALYLDHQSRMRSLTEFGIQNIRQLKFCIVSECSDMESIVDGGSVIDEIALPNLSHLSLHYLWNLNKIWKGVITAGSFNALKVLSVHTCPRLEFVLSCSIVQHFPSLEDLIVEDCAAVTEIIICESQIEACTAEFPKLKRLELHYLPQLRRICHRSYQNTEHITIQYCPKLESSRPP